MVGPEPQRSIGMHPHQSFEGPTGTDGDMMELDSPLKVRSGTLDGMDVDASEPPAFVTVGGIRKQPAPAGGMRSEAYGATERRNVAAENSACPTRIIHSKPLATAGAVSVSTTRTLPRPPTARRGMSVTSTGCNISSTETPGGIAGRTDASFNAPTDPSSVAGKQASTSRTDQRTNTAMVAAETAIPGIGSYKPTVIDTRRHANDLNREENEKVMKKATKTVVHAHGSGINEKSKAPDLHHKPESCKSSNEGRNAVGKDDRTSDEATYYGHAHPPYPGYSQYYRHHYHPHHAAMHYHHSSKGPGGKDVSSTSMSAAAQQQAAHQYQAQAYHQWYQAYGRQYHHSQASRNADSKKSQDKEKDGKDGDKNDKPKDGPATLAKSVSKADDETTKTEDMPSCKQSTSTSEDSTSDQVPSATSWESHAAAQAAAAQAAAAHAYAAQAHHSYWSRYYSHHAQSSTGQHGYWPSYHSNDIRWSGSNSSNNTNAATAGSGHLSDPATVDTYGNDSENFRKRHRDAPRHRAENLRLGKSDSRDGAVADARDDFNTLPGIDDDSASTGSIGGFSMGSLGRPPFILPESLSPQNSKRRKGTGRSQAIHRAQPDNIDSDNMRLIKSNSTLSEGNMTFTNLSINNSYSAELAAFYDPSPTNSIETKKHEGGKMDLGKTPKKDNKSAKKSEQEDASLVFRLNGDSKTPEEARNSPTMFELIGGAETPTTGLLMTQFMENTTTEDLNRHMRSHAFTPMPVAWPMANDESFKTASRNSQAASGGAMSDPHNTSGFSIASNPSWTMSTGDASQCSTEKRLLEISPRYFGLLDSTKSSKTNNPLGSPKSFWKETTSDRNRINDDTVESKPSEKQGALRSINSLLSPTMRNMEATNGDTLDADAIRSMSPLPLYFDGYGGDVPVIEITNSNVENIESAPAITAPSPAPVLDAVPSSTRPIPTTASSSSDANKPLLAAETKPQTPKSKPQSPKMTKSQTVYPRPIHPAHSSWSRPMSSYSGHPPPHWPMPPMPPGAIRHPAVFGKHGSSPAPPGPPPPHPAAVPPPPYPQGMYPPHHYNPHDRVRNLRGKGPPRHTMPPPHMLPPHHYGHFSPMRGAPPGVEREEPDFHDDNSQRRCVPLKPPIPPKFHGDMQKYAEVDLPEFSTLVNFPSNSSGSSKTVIPLGMKHCVMCGTVCHTSGSAVKKAKQQGKTPLGNSHCNASAMTSLAPSLAPSGQVSNVATIPMQNKGLCTNCDVGVWVVVSSGMEIKWCKGCKNFRTWAAFGDKGLATKCVRCRDRQREKYAQSKRDQDRRRAAVPCSLTAATRKLPLQPSSRQHGDKFQ